MKAILKLWIFENHKFDVSSKKRSCIKGTHLTNLGFGQMLVYNFKEHILKHKKSTVVYPSTRLSPDACLRPVCL